MLRSPTQALSSPWSALRVLFVLALVGASVIAVANRPAHAATLSPVASFGSNPGNLAMYAYVPDGLPASAPLVVALHGCTQNANAYYSNSGWRKFADQHGFALVFPEQRSANHSSSCFNWFVEGDIRRGQGEALSIKQMVDTAVASHNLDADRVYITGLSAGAAMTAVMLATYPDVFAAGSIVAGIPYRCAPETSPYLCMFLAVDKTPAAWGNAVRSAFSGYGGRWPRVSIWHGTSDSTVVPANATELRDQWTNVHGIPATPTSTGSLPAGTSVENYDSGGVSLVRVHRVSGMGHGTPVDPGPGAQQCGTTAAYFLDTICSAYHDAVFFGLVGGSGPGPTSTPSASPTTEPTTEPTTTPQPCFTASNYAHVVAGRAHMSLGYVYANGSNQAMGLYNVFVTHTLRQTGPNHYVLADGGC